MPSLRPLLRLPDRTAVLAVGVAAGFAIGLSFNEGGRRAVADRLFASAPDAPADLPAAPPAASVAVPPSRRAPAPEAVGGLDPRVVARVRGAAGKLRVGVFGDSFGDGIWAALYHQLPGKAGFDVLRFSKEATGFTRYRQLDLTQRAHEQVAGEPIDAAVISFGANDVQPIFADGHLRALMSDGWQKVIGERIDAFVREARASGAQVWWLGLPVMRDGEMDGSIRAMNAFYARRMAALGVPFVDTRAASLDLQGHYAPYLPDSDTGEPRLMRAGDGVHMSMLGYQRLTAGLAGRIKVYAARVRAQAGLAPAPTATPSPTAPRPPAPRPTPTASHTPRPAPTHSARPLGAAEADDRATARANRREEHRQVERTRDAAAGATPTPSPSPMRSPQPAHDEAGAGDRPPAHATRRPTERSRDAASPTPSVSPTHD